MERSLIFAKNLQISNPFASFLEEQSSKGLHFYHICRPYDPQRKLKDLIYFSIAATFNTKHEVLSKNNIK